jgi:hypothetical protein
VKAGNLNSIKCDNCGQFIAVEAMAEGRAKFYYTPESDRSRERCDWVCEKCEAEGKGGPNPSLSPVREIAVKVRSISGLKPEKLDKSK